MAYGLSRWKNILFGMYFFRLARKYPAAAKKRLIEMLKPQLPKDYDIATHFTPNYNPWDQRICLVPDADMFKALSDGRASIVTDHIEALTEKGIRLKSGKALEADIIVTATGLKLEVWNGLEVNVDGKRINAAETLAYKGMMYSGIPNLASSFGYTNASWTLKCDLTCDYVCRLLNTLDDRRADFAVPENTDASVEQVPFLDFSSGYVQRAMEKFPRQGSKKPWALHQNYVRDLALLRWGKIDDGTLKFRNAKPAEAQRPLPVAAE
jgi:cation diffusion facilitator CzcD-associated flavoprotein CzcO